MSPRFLAPLVLAAAVVPLNAADASRPVSFNRDIRPIMSNTCFHCHGFDAKTREAGMRLDVRDEALKPTKNGVIPIVPGKPEESEVIHRISDTVEPMPPEEAHKALTPAQKDLFRRWIAEGAVYEPHWAYAALTRPAVPRLADPAAATHPIDAFIRAKLAEKKVAPSPPADPVRLLRRLSFDLTGLPPNPEELAAFQAAASRDPQAALRDATERLLASPRHGERLAVWWLDVARYADTVGFHGDQNQRIFPYRDYVINAFNANRRFDQFTIEQLAGDLLPNPTTEQIVATGYNRLNMMTREGGAQPKEYLAKYGAERVRSVAAAWFGSTFGCAECHDHKFDPIKTADFYQLQAFFADVKQWGVYSDYRYTPNPDLKNFTNDHPFPPELEVTSPYLVARKQRLEGELAAQRATATAQSAAPAFSAAFAEWLADARSFTAREPSGWQQPPVTAARVRGRELVRDGQVPLAADGSIRLAKALARTEAVRVTLASNPGRIAALRLEVTGPRANAAADESDDAFDQVRLAALVRGGDGKERKVDFVFADATAKIARYEHGAEVLGIVSGWRIPRAPADARPAGTWLLATPLALAAGETLELTLTGSLARPLRVLTSPFGAGSPSDVASPAVRAALPAAPETLTADQRALLAETWLLSTAYDRAAFERHHRLRTRIRETRGGRAWTLVTEAIAPLPMRVLPRGNWQDESGPLVLPATPSFLPARRESTPEQRLTRLDLARWIVSAENPLTARVVMNRLWAMFFGTGLSAAVDDLGSQGEPPSHPELLDWLASEFRDRGWDLRHMIRLIVTSATYRQSSQVRPELRELDPANRLLAAQNPRRLEAEFVRDNALYIAGALNLRDVGGPSVKPYQPAGYYAQLQFPDRDYVASDDDEQWRRGLYMHWQRTFLHPMLANFDAPSRDECAAQRVVSNTPQQALTLLNDPTFVEAARLFAARVAAAGATDEARLRQAFLLALAREPKPAETASLQRFLATQREHYRGDVDAAQKLLRVGLAPVPAGDPAELAAWTSVARVILNGQEVITRY
ncbi:MAG: PSD1 domain-containing protein [Opitutaceae bacterium]|nr:PSD1 domain-containing protein [Opitutaceae bacterium]